MLNEQFHHDWRQLRVYLTRKEAQGDLRCLQAQGIPTVLRGVKPNVLGTLPLPGPLGIELMVPAADHGRAREFLPVDFE